MYFKQLILLLSLLLMATSISAKSEIEGEMPKISGANGWLNSKPLSKESLKGKVVLIDFWTYSCINCLRSIPYVEAWSKKYKDDGLVVIGVHSPEFAFEKNSKNIKKAIKKYGITYPIANDSDHKIWDAFKNRFWPAHYFIDRQGHIRHHHFGEGEYDKSEEIIKELLAENGSVVKEKQVTMNNQGALASGSNDVASHETYVGFNRTKNFSSNPQIKRNSVAQYKLTHELTLNQWGLEGSWFVNAESSTLRESGGKVLYRFHARDLHLVLGSHKGEIPFTVKIDGHAPKSSHGADIDTNGKGKIVDHRLYQLIRQSDKDAKEEHTFEIEFSKPGVEVYAFTFG